jgi:Na+/proline symporter
MEVSKLHLLDWFVLLSTLLFIVIYGVYKTKKLNNGVEDYIKGGKDTKWWTIGLSVMATQASAITFLSTPGQAFHDGMGFVQFYFGLPIAMVIICLVFIPIYYKLNVYTAYEFLETRFDLKTRTLTAFLFLIQRGLAAGITIYAPAIILSYVLDCTKYCYRCSGYFLHCFRRNKGSKCNSEAANDYYIFRYGYCFYSNYVLHA